MKKPFAIPDDADVEYVYDGLMRLGAQLCLETLDAIVAADGHPETVAQNDSSLFTLHSSLKPAPKIFKETCEIDWTKSAKQVYDFVAADRVPCLERGRRWPPPTARDGAEGVEDAQDLRSRVGAQARSASI